MEMLHVGHATNMGEEERNDQDFLCVACDLNLPDLQAIHTHAEI